MYERKVYVKINMIKKILKIILKFSVSIVMIGCIFMALVFYCNWGPFNKLRTLWVTTAMTTFKHQWLATDFISGTEINKILNSNRVVATNDKTNIDESKVNNNSSEKSESNLGDMVVKASSFSTSDNISIININENNYTGKLMIVDNPKRIQLATIDKFSLNIKGDKLLELAQNNYAVAAINASAFVDPNGTGNGGVPMGIVVKDGKVIYNDTSGAFNIVGFDYSGRLITGQFTLEDIAKNNIKDAVSFGPALIINGKPVTIEGDGGSGLQPRTAIGQTADGKVLLLEIDGRQPLYSVGASIKDVQDILVRYGAINASNLDGGSSTAMYYNGKIINKPCGPLGSTGGRYLPTAFLVTK